MLFYSSYVDRVIPAKGATTCVRPPSGSDMFNLSSYTVVFAPPMYPSLPLSVSPLLLLVLTISKNAVRGESIGYDLFGQFHARAVHHDLFRMDYLRSHVFPPHTPLRTVKAGHQCHKITRSTITQMLRSACTNVGGELGLQTRKNPARSL